MIDVAIIGAGPYGLSAAAHLGSVPALSVRVFGEPMSFWDRDMPKGMLLRSPWAASHLSDPRRSFTLESFVNACGNHVGRPIPRQRFVEYGSWFQRRAVPGIDRRAVSCVQRDGSGYRVTLEGEETVWARRVVVAAGIGAFAWIPEEFRGLAETVVSHSLRLRETETFRGGRVAVIGAGQSALESAALLREAGAGVEVIARGPVRFLRRSSALHALGPVSRLLYAPADVGPAGISRLVGAPRVFQRLPRPVHDSWRKRSVRPAGAWWLVPRLQGVTLTSGVRVSHAEAGHDGVVLLLNDGSMRCVDHVILATGYRVDISRYAFLPAPVLDSVRRVDGFPTLTRGLESSLPGLHFIGAPAAWTYGPLLQFVAGADFAARELARYIRK